MTILIEMKICTIVSSFAHVSQKGCINGWSEGGALREGDKKVIDKTRRPVFDAKLFTLAFFDLHLRENETAATEFPDGCARTFEAAAVDPPIPKRKDENIR